ncbi:MAG: hypothetical protein H0T92_17190 [Pyrinomonadaceae bacterium]|nr:hypothetical protein [Pyrinomonadaceae bacterium]
MLHYHYRTRSFLTLFFLAATILAIPVEAAAPRLLMIYGKQLPKPIILANWQENQRLMSAITEEAKVTPEELKGRPYLEVALFSGLEWVRYVDQGKPLDKLRPKQASQHGRFYPAVGDAAPIMTFKSLPGPGPLTRRVDAKGVEILAGHGIPVRLDATNKPPAE